MNKVLFFRSQFSLRRLFNLIGTFLCLIFPALTSSLVIPPYSPSLPKPPIAASHNQLWRRFIGKSNQIATLNMEATIEQRARGRADPVTETVRFKCPQCRNPTSYNSEKLLTKRSVDMYRQKAKRPSVRKSSPLYKLKAENYYFS